jgi:hypothetical protein
MDVTFNVSANALSYDRLNYMRQAARIIAICIIAISLETLGKPIDPDPSRDKPRSAPATDEKGPVVPPPELDVTQPPEDLYRTKDAYFYKYERAFTVHVGPYLINSDGLVTYWVYGFTYLWENPGMFHFESGVENITFGEGHLWTVGRWNFMRTKKFRPFVSAGPGLRLVPSNGLATFLKLANYFARATVGFEYSVAGPTSLRAEIFSGADSEGRLFFGVTGGYTVGLD